MKTLTGLVLFPFSGSGSKSQRIQKTIQHGLEEAGVEAGFVAFGDLNPGVHLQNTITEKIQGSDLIIADITDQNPNVLYEIGYAHALRKPTILLVDTDAAVDIPANLAGFQIITYDANSHDALVHRIRRAVQAQTERLKTAS